MSGYDVIVVGARCAGSPTAMLLARKGYRVLVVDRATFPSDTVSTHIVHAPGVTALKRWGLLDRVVATGCPPIDTYLVDLDPLVISGSPRTDDAPVAYAPRRTVLDRVLVEAAAEAGAEVREGFSVEELVTDDDGRVTGIRGHGERGVTEHAAVVIGADGRHSMVAEAVGAGRYHEKPQLLGAYYSYWSDLPMHGRFETYVRPHRGFAAWPTNDDLTVVIVGWPFAEFGAFRSAVESSYLSTIELAPPFAERIRAARRETRFVGTAVSNVFRTPYGPGWALVGDAGYNRDFITGFGIGDAFLDAEASAEALDAALSGRRPFDEAMAAYQVARDERVLPFYELTTEIATLEPPRPEMERVLRALPGNQEAMDAFARVMAAAESPVEFFDESNVTRILERAEGRGVRSG
jgi:2-polyprenyl-6-methoxyphenol hydroxylase-like FAD-dependent oxidoreductase